jgi:hypothetical protein
MTPAPSAFTDVRKGALFARITAAAGLVFPVWNSTHQILALGQSRTPLWTMPMIVLALFTSSLLPLFYFALYRDTGGLRITKGLRRLALVAVLILSVFVALGLPGWIESFARTSVLAADRELWTIRDTSFVLDVSSSLGTILLLVALSRQRDEDSSRHPVSRLLSIVTNVAVVTWGLWVAFQVVRLVLTPYTYTQLRDYAAQVGRTSPSLAYLIRDAARSLLTQAALFTAPLVIWRSRRSAFRTRTEPEPG